MNVRPYPMYYEDVAVGMKALGFVGKAAYEAARKYKHIIDRDFKSGVLPGDCSKNIEHEIMSKPQTIKNINYKKGPQCRGYHVIL